MKNCMFYDICTLLCCPLFQMSFRPLLQGRLGPTEMRMRQNVYSYFVNEKEKQMCLHVNERKFETLFGGFSAETIL